MRVKFTIIFLVLLASYAHAGIKEFPIKSNIKLEAGQAESITIDSNEEIEVNWITVQDKECVTNCIEATDKSGGYEYKISSKLGAGMKYRPVNSKIIIEYKNISDQPVLINVSQQKSTCDAEACAFIDKTEKARSLIFRIDKFLSIETSKDESYSIISGVTTEGDPFKVKAVWWTDNNSFIPMNCRKTIKRYLEEKTPEEIYKPYILAGSAIGYKEIILKNVDTCSPKALHFGVSSEDVVYRVNSLKPSVEVGFDAKLFLTQSEFLLNSPGKLNPMINFKTNSAFAVLTDDSLSGQYNALKIFFFKKSLNEDDLSHIQILEKQYDAVMVLFLDKENKVWQVNLTCVIPGNTIGSTVSWKPEDYFYDGKRLKLKTKGNYHNLDSQNSIDLAWDINLDISVFNELKQNK